MAEMQKLNAQQVFQQMGLIDVMKQGMYADRGENAARDAGVAEMRMRPALSQELYTDILKNPGEQLAARGAEISQALTYKEAEYTKAHDDSKAAELKDIRTRLDDANSRGALAGLKPEPNHRITLPETPQGATVESGDVKPQTSLPTPERGAPAPNVPSK